MSTLLTRAEGIHKRIALIEPQAASVIRELVAEVIALREELADYQVEQAQLDAHSARAL